MITDNELKAACEALVEMWHVEVKPMLKEFNDLYEKIVAPARTERAKRIIKKFKMDNLEFDEGYGIDGAWRVTHVGGVPDTLIPLFGYSENAYMPDYHLLGNMKSVLRKRESDALWTISGRGSYTSRQDAILGWRKQLLKLREECHHLFKDAKVFVDAALAYMNKVDELDANEDEEFRKAFGIEPKPKTYKVTLVIEEA